MHVINHEKCGNGAFFHVVKIDRSFSIPSAVVFGVNLFFRKADGSAIAVDRFQIDRVERGENIFRAIRAVSVMRNDDGAIVGNGVNGSFQEISSAEKYAVEHKSAEEDKEQSEKTERASCRRSGNCPEYGKAHPENCKDRQNRRCLSGGNFSGCSRPEHRFARV